MTADEYFIDWCNGFEFDVNQIEELMKEYARLKCKELLEIVAEKAKYKITENIVEGRVHLTYEFDKDSILNAVDLDELIK